MTLVATFTIPLSCAPTMNEWGRSSNSVAWKRAKVKQQAWSIMLGQYVKQFQKTPPNTARLSAITRDLQMLALTGRRVICTRYSSSEPDRYAGWSKVPVDLLQVPRGNRKRGLCLIFDDSPRYTTVEERWVKAKRGYGEVVVEVFR